MNVDSFFKAIDAQYEKQLPFVVYSRPINSIITCWLQNNDQLYTTKSFSESGFVFAPFDNNHPAIIFPEKACDQIVLEASELNINTNTDAETIVSSDREDHINLVSKGIDAIKNSELKKVVLSRCVDKTINNSKPLDVFKRLFNNYINAMVYCWYHPKVGLWLGATPELLFKIEGKQLTTISLAGTQAVDDYENVSWTKKEIEEQQIVTDYIINQLKPYTNQLNVSEVETVRAGNLFHLKSRITSLIDDSTHLKSIIAALHPTPAVCGFPKDLAKDFILKNEGYDRAYYTGFLGELNLMHSKTRNLNKRNVENNAYAIVKTSSNFYVNLRCAQFKDDGVLIYVGGGITKESIAENEWQETVNKTKTIVKVLN